MPPTATPDQATAPDQATDACARWRALGTLVQLVVTDPRRLPEAQRLLAADLAEVDAACSRFRADSEIRALQNAHGRPVRVTPLLAEAIAVALRAARLTDGDVDPTVGAAMSAVGYDRDFDRIPRIGPPLVVTTRTVPGWREVHLEGRSLGPDRRRCGALGAAGGGLAAARA
jgi:thiamine biosynthesis lipoprotein ApbE